MARIAGVNVPTNKRLIIALTYIYGIGPKYSKDNAIKWLDGSKRVNSLNEDEIIKIREFIDKNFLVEEGDLRRGVSVRIKRLTDLGCYRG